MRKPSDVGRTFLLSVFFAVVSVSGLIFFTFRKSTPASRSFGYRNVEGLELSLDAYFPPDWKSTDRRPCIVWFFGGGWEVGVPVQYARHSEHFTKLGMVCLTPDYRVKKRHGSRFTPFDALDDARAAMSWVRDHSAELGIDPKRIAAAGGSAGGHLALSCAVIAGGAGGGASPAPNALILFNPVVDFDIPIVAKKADPAERKRLIEIAPLHRITAPLPPTLIFHGCADAVVPIQTSESFVARAKEVGSQRIEFIRYPGMRHEFHLAGKATRKEYRKSLGEIQEFLGSLGWCDRP